MGGCTFAESNLKIGSRPCGHCFIIQGFPALATGDNGLGPGAVPGLKHRVIAIIATTEA